jgi:hypothetical protein
MIYLYAICDGSALPAGLALTGLDGAPVWAVAGAGLVAAVSMTDRHSVSPHADLAWQHESVVERLMENGGVLPARFGTLAPDMEALTAQLHNRRTEFAASLDRVRGRVEISVRVLWDDAGAAPRAAGERVDPAPTGRAYLLRRQAEEQSARERQARGAALAETLHAALSAVSVDAVRRVLATPRMLLTGAYLVDRGRMDDFRLRLDALTTQHTSLRFMSTGPWPAYNFVALADRAAADGKAVQDVG